MKVLYREFDGNNWTHEFEISSFPAVINGDSAKELLLCAENMLLDTSNNCQIEIEQFAVMSSQRGFRYQRDNGVDFVSCKREALLSEINWQFD